MASILQRQLQYSQSPFLISTDKASAHAQKMLDQL